MKKQAFGNYIKWPFERPGPLIARQSWVPEGPIGPLLGCLVGWYTSLVGFSTTCSTSRSSVGADTLSHHHGVIQELENNWHKVAKCVQSNLFFLKYFWIAVPWLWLIFEVIVTRGCMPILEAFLSVFSAFFSAFFSGISGQETSFWNQCATIILLMTIMIIFRIINKEYGKVIKRFK